MSISINKCKNDLSYSKSLELHPCFSREAHFKHGRIHLPVSPTCNIQCKFCKRTLNKSEIRPGVSNVILSPKKAVETLDKALQLCPEITVVGVAGPGDTLATEYALETFALVHQKYPHLIKCLSTNGLLLSKYAHRIVEVGVKTITVTVNAVDADVLKNICSYIVDDGEILYGEKAALKLISRQLEGIRKISELGVVVKINTVLIPGVNDEHIEEIIRTVEEAGASLINIIPLIPQGDMANLQAPSSSDLEFARETAEKYLPVFRHCRQCRADACGIPGSKIDLSSVLYGESTHTFSHG